MKGFERNTNFPVHVGFFVPSVCSRHVIPGPDSQRC
jgi:hypothetical protein